MIAAYSGGVGQEHSRIDAYSDSVFPLEAVTKLLF
jgi:hypothetical protein